MAALADVILPVFVVLGAGYIAAWRGWFSGSGADGLMDFTQKFAIPCLLFRAISDIDLDAEFDLGLLGSFYIGVAFAFVMGALGALHDRQPQKNRVRKEGCKAYRHSILGRPPEQETRA